MQSKVLADIEFCLLELKNDNISNTILQKLKNNLNKLTNVKCEKIMYTKNTDKLFFGMSVVPVLASDQVYDILCTDSNKIKIDKYYLEIDSKLFESGIDLNGRELTAIILHEIGHIEGPEPTKKIREAVDAYLASTDSTLNSDEVGKHYKYYRFGILDAYQKICNVFNANIQEEIDADAFVVKIGYGEYLESALNKIYKSGFMLNSDVDNKFIVLSWVLRICKDFNLSRIPAIRKLERAQKLTGSQLEKEMIKELIRNTDEYTPYIRESAIIQTCIEERAKSFLGRFKYKGMRGFEDDLAEFTMRARNVDREDEAILLMRSINSRMGIIDDYISSEELDDLEKERWYDLYRRYSTLRNELSEKNVYRNKDFSIYINYPDIKPVQ